MGSHPIEWVHAPDLALFNRYMEAADGAVRLVTVAAEIPGMPDFVKELSARGITVSLGHQMATTPAEIAPCVAAGAKAFTHLGNGIPNMIPRHDNIVMTALAEDRASVMFIPDGHHLPDTMLKVYCRPFAASSPSPTRSILPACRRANTTSSAFTPAWSRTVFCGIPPATASWAPPRRWTR